MQRNSSVSNVLHMLFFKALLNPLAALSCHLQGDTVDLLFACASLEALYATLQRFRSPSQDCTELDRFLSSTKSADGSFISENVHFKEVKLCNVQESILNAFNTAQCTYIDSLLQYLHGRFDEMRQNSAFKGIKLLDTRMWPTASDSLCEFGNSELSLVIEHFRSLDMDQRNVAFPKKRIGSRH